MLAKAIPTSLSATRWDIVHQLGTDLKEGESRLNKDIVEKLPSGTDHQKAMKELDNMARQTDILEKVITRDARDKKVVSYKLSEYGLRFFAALDSVEKRAIRQHTGKVRGANKPKPISYIPLQESFDIVPSVGVDTLMSAVDDLVKENASLRAGLISTMKIKLDSLNKLRDLLGYGPLVDANETREEDKK